MKKALWWLIQATVLTFYLAWIAGMGLFYGATWMSKFLNVVYLLIRGQL